MLPRCVGACTSGPYHDALLRLVGIDEHMVWRETSIDTWDAHQHAHAIGVCVECGWKHNTNIAEWVMPAAILANTPAVLSAPP